MIENKKRYVSPRITVFSAGRVQLLVGSRGSSSYNPTSVQLGFYEYAPKKFEGTISEGVSNYPFKADGTLDAADGGAGTINTPGWTWE